MNLSHYFLILLKIILKGHRPLWDFTNNELIEESLCKNDYASPAVYLFFCSFFSLYSIFSIKLLQKKTFSCLSKFLMFFFHFIFIGIIIILLGVMLDEYLHQLVFTIILGFILLCFLLEKDKRIHNFIFKALKNIYNTRIYKMKIFFNVIGLVVLTIISLFFIDENESNVIKQTLKKINSCTDEDFQNFGIKQSFIDLSYIFGVVGAFWGASFTVESNIGKWWGSSSKGIFIIKVLSIILFNIIFILAKYLSPYLFNIYELNFVLSSLINFLQYFCLFGIIPLFLDKMKLIEKKRKLRKNSGSIKKSIRDEEDDNVILFKTSIFRDEKRKKEDEGFVVLDKEVKKRSMLFDKKEEDDKIKNKTDKEKDNEKLNISDNDNEEEVIIYDKSDEEKEEIYGPSPLVENVHNIEEEEEYNLYLEGMNNADENNQDK